MQGQIAKERRLAKMYEFLKVIPEVIKTTAAALSIFSLAIKGIDALKNRWNHRKNKRTAFRRSRPEL
jgi:hypothetical protein